jgi:hypothetical protein
MHCGAVADEQRDEVVIRSDRGGRGRKDRSVAEHSLSQLSFPQFADFILFLQSSRRFDISGVPLGRSISTQEHNQGFKLNGLGKSPFSEETVSIRKWTSQCRQYLWRA